MEEVNPLVPGSRLKPGMKFGQNNKKEDALLNSPFLNVASESKIRGR